MIVTANRLRSIGWIALLLLCGALLMVLAFRVNALRSQVHRAEAKIVALKQEKMYLETEFETRANQQQLKAWNDVEFGYVAPTAGQYLENERQLASLSMPADPGAPEPIRVASMDDAVVAQAAFPAMVSPLTGQPMGADAPAVKIDASADGAQPVKVDHATAAASLGEKLATVRRSDDEPAKAKVKDKADTKVKTAGKESVKATAKTAAKKTVEKVAAKPSVKNAAKPKAAAVKTAKAGDSKPNPKTTKPVKLAMKDEKTRK
ncbi:hypothetical protein [Novosphingobium cyanobacteriorum]|uniref:Cell division protein FtsL n=1 Tax=Novosphingobium cyanobacteriorum TaxID=3024215 RepID=A0ABT6CHP6_9SPHN|nr:hypothetical protein [Novosphingobium cyanobacteriorum]MDF8333327.1 hypothetical protein [Novosphingobium cyanobacteriorum]